jgi:hypothetical protein
LDSVSLEVQALENKWYAVCHLLELEKTMPQSDALATVCRTWAEETDRPLGASTLRRWKKLVLEEHSLTRKVLERFSLLYSDFSSHF